jgi:hypothetical protein
MMEAAFPSWCARVEFWDVDDVDCAEPAVALPQVEAAVERTLARLCAAASVD